MLAYHSNGVSHYIVTDAQIVELMALEQLKRSGAPSEKVTAAVQDFINRLPIVEPKSQAA